MEELITFKSIEIAVAALSENDAKLANLFHVVGELTPPHKSLEFSSVSRIIINQQLSGKAADTIFGRIENRFPNLIPNEILNAENEVLRACGVSNAKVKYLKALAQKLIERPGYFEEISQMESGLAKEEIWSNKGFGEWSSEIFLLFHLKRADIYPKGDVTLNKVVGKIFEIDPKDEKKIYELSESWSPYRSIVSLALWQFFDNGLMSLK